MDYETRSQKYISEEASSSNCDFDFLISDFVFEVFPIAARFGIPSFGVAHFTWDWFFSKMFPAGVKPVPSQRMGMKGVGVEGVEVDGEPLAPAVSLEQTTRQSATFLLNRTLYELPS